LEIIQESGSNLEGLTSFFDDIKGGMNDEVKFEFIGLRVKASQIERVVLDWGLDNERTKERKRPTYPSSNNSDTCNHSDAAGGKKDVGIIKKKSKCRHFEEIAD
jgi:hypothetical protein